MANYIKYSTSTQSQALKVGNFWIGTGEIKKGPTSVTDYWNGITPPTGGYTIYGDKGGNGPYIYVASDDSDLIYLTNRINDTNFTTVNDIFNYYATQSNKTCVNKDYESISTIGLKLNIDAGFIPSYPRSGTTWYDMGPSGSNATNSGASYSNINSGIFSYSGSGQYTSWSTLDNSLINWWNSTSRTFQIWIYFNSVSTGRIFGVSDLDSFQDGYYISAGKLYSISNTNETTIGPTIVTDNWYHIVWTRTSSSSNTLYLNGNLIGNTSQSFNNIDNTWYMSLMSNGYGTLANGYISNVQFYDGVLNSTQINNNYQAMYLSRFVPSRQNLVLYLDAGYSISYPRSGTTWRDVSGSGNNGTLINQPTYSSLDGGSISFDGVNDYVQLPVINIFTGSYTIGLWAKPIDTADLLNVIGGASGNLSIFLQGGSSDNYRYVSFNSTATSISTPGVNDDWTDGSWNYFTVTFDIGSSIATVYVNASPLASGAFTTISSTSPDIKIAYGYPFRGNISIFSLHNTALSSIQISQIFNSQRLRFGI